MCEGVAAGYYNTTEMNNNKETSVVQVPGPAGRSHGAFERYMRSRESTRHDSRAEHGGQARIQSDVRETGQA